MELAVAIACASDVAPPVESAGIEQERFYLEENLLRRMKRIAIAAATVPQTFNQSRPCRGVK